MVSQTPDLSLVGDLKMSASDEQGSFSDDLTDRRFKDYDNNTETKEAFVRGFLEGLRRSKKIGSEMYNKFIDMVECQELMDEPTADPLLIENSLSKMIENNQNITHKSLSDWENKNLAEAGDDIPEKGNPEEFKSALSCFMIHNSSNSELISRSSSEPKLTPIDNLKFTETQNSKSDEKIKRAKSNEKVGHGDRKLLTISKTNINFGLKGNESGKAPYDEVELNQLAKENSDRYLPRLNTLKVADKASQENWPSSKYPSNIDDEKRLNSPDMWMRKIMVKPKQKFHRNSNRNRTPKRESRMEDSLRETESPLVNSNANIHQKHMADGRKDRKLITNDDIIPFDSFDGWTTKLGPFTTNDNLHLSLSESLHPVESFDRLDLQKDEKDTTNYNETCVLENTENYKTYTNKPKDPGNTCTSHRNSPFVPHETLGSDKKTYETNAFKAYGGKSQRKPLMTKIKSQTDLVKLRLTRSCCESPKSNRNVPISRSQSLQNRKKFLSDISVTKNLDLSEKLAYQLKDMRKEEVNRPASISNLLNYQRSAFSSRGGNRIEQCHKDANNGLPYQTDSDNGQQLNEMHLSLSQIFATRVYTPEKSGQEIEDGKRPYQSVTDYYLPPISGKSILKIQRAKTNDVTEDIVSEYQHALTHIPVPAENSVLKVDKERSANVTVPRDFPRNKWMLCATCGGVKAIKMPDNPNKYKEAIVEETSSLDILSAKEQDVLTLKNEPVDEVRRHKAKDAGKNKSGKKRRNSSKPQRENDSNGSKDTEVHIEYKDTDIKLTCEVTVASSGKDNDETGINENKNEIRTPRRIDEMAVASHREKMECPVMKETRIYGRTKKLSNEEGDSLYGDVAETPTSEATTPSAYLEYCKRREQMRTNKQDLFHEDMNNILSDTFTADLASKVRTAEGRFLPVIPKRRSYDSIKRKTAQENKLCPRSKSLITKPPETVEDRVTPYDLVVTPCSLPILYIRRMR